MGKDRVLKSTAVVSACTALSRVLGLARNVLMATMFGTSLVQSAFVIAFRIPNLFRRLFGEGALSAAFIPVFTETIEKEGLEKANILAGRVMSMLGAALAMIVIGGILVASALIAWVPLGERAATFLPLLRLLLPYMFFICLVALCMAILNSFHHFFVPAATPIVLNVVWIATLLWICPLFGESPGKRIYGVALGILAAGGIQFLVQIPVLLKFKISPPLAFSWHDEKVRKVLLLMGPAALGMGIFQINVLMDDLLAFIAGPWGPATLSFSMLIVYMPLGIVGTALGTVLLPTFSRQAAQNAPDKIRETLGESLGRLMMVMVPASIGLMVLAHPIVQLIYEWPNREFDAFSTRQTARALMFYAPGLTAFGVYKVLVPAFYALKDTRTPVRIGMYMVGLNFVLNLLFVFTWPEYYRHAGLAFATVLSSAVNGIILGRILHKRIGSPGWGKLLAMALKVLIGALIMGGVVYAFHAWFIGAVMQDQLPKLRQVAAVGSSIIVGLAVYGGLAVAARPKSS